MKTFFSPTMTAIVAAAMLAGCSSDGGVLGSSLTTSSVDAAKAAATPKLDPACVALTAKIDALRKDGVTERAEKVAAGKTQTVSVKRESLAKLTELDRANADYQAKCSVPGLARPVSPAPAAAVVPAAPAAKVSSAATKPAAPKKVAKVEATAAALAVIPATAPAIAPAAVPAAPAAVPAPVAAAPAAVAPPAGSP